MRSPVRSLSIALVSFAFLMTAVAQMPTGPLPPGAKKVPGEKWRTKQSMKMGGMSMPGRTTEVCLAKGRETEGASQPPDKNCRIYDVSQSGSKFSAKFSCTGQNAGEGSMETRREGDTLISDIFMRSKDGEMNMHSETTKLGGACEAIDYSGVKLEAPPPPPDMCVEMFKKKENDFRIYPSLTARSANAFIGKGAQCAGKPIMKDYCAAVQTHSGYFSLRAGEYQIEKVIKESGDASAYKPDPSMRTPLLTSVQSCGLGKGKAAVEALRTRLLADAEAKNAWTFMVAEGDDAMHAHLQQLAKENCSGRGFTETKAKQFRSLCLYYGPDLINGRFQQARNTAFGEPNDEATAASGSGGADGSGSNATDASNPEAEKANKAKETLDKGKKLLRGILGR